MKIYKNKHISGLLIVLFTIFAFSACGDSNDDTEDLDGDTDVNIDGDIDGDTDENIEGTTSLRAIHLSPDAPAVDILVNGQLRAIEDLEFAESTAFLDIPSGTYDFDIVPSGGELDESVLNIQGLDLMDGIKYTAVAFGMLSSIAPTLLEENLDDPGENMIRIRAIHTADGVGEVDIWNIPEDGDPAIIYEDVAYGDVGDFLELPSGSYTLGFDVDNDSNPDLVFKTGDLAEGSILNAFAIKNGDEIFLMVQLSDGTTLRIDPEENEIPETSEVRFIHLAPSVGDVDVWVDESIKAVEELSFGESSDYATVSAGSHDVALVNSGETDVSMALLSPSVELEADTNYTAIAFESSGAQALLIEDDLSTTGDGMIRVRAIHTADGVGEVDIWNITDINNPSPLFVDLGEKEASEAALIPAGTYVIGFDVDNDTVVDLAFSLPELSSGTIVNLFAVNDDGDIFLTAQFSDSTTARIDPVEWAYVRVLHLSAGTGEVDIFVDSAETAAIEMLDYREGTGYVALPAGQHDFDISLTGTGLGASALTISDLDLASGKFYTAYAYNVETTKSSATLSAATLEDDTSLPESGKIRVRAIHTALGVGEVDIWNFTDRNNPMPLYENVGFGVVGDAKEIPAGMYTLGIDVNDDKTPEYLFELPDLAEGTIANLFASLDDSGNLYLVAHLYDGTTASIMGTATSFIRILHLSPDAGDVDIWVNNSIKAVTELGYIEGTDYLELESGEYDFDIKAAGSDENSASVKSLIDTVLDAGTRYTVFAFGILDGDVNNLKVGVAVDDFTSADEGDFSLRAIHAADGVGTVDIWNIPTEGSPSMLPGYDDVPYEAAGGYLSLDPGIYTIGFDLSPNDANPDVTFTTPNLEAGLNLNVFAVNDNDGVKLVAQLNDGTLAVISAD